MVGSTCSPFYGNRSSSGCSMRNVVLVLLLTTGTILPKAFAQIQCQDDSSCPPNSRCLLPEGMCSNPFEKGCLQAVLGPEKRDYYASSLLRVCNSDDDQHQGRIHSDSLLSSAGEEHQPSSPVCQLNPLDYPEIRILAQNWQEPAFWGWVLQIILSEIANVPATLETGVVNKHASFYHPTMSWDYADLSYDYDSLRVGNTAQGNICPSYHHHHQQQQSGGEEDATTTTTVDGTAEEETSSYVGCAHVMPEAWSGQRQAWREAEAEGLIESVSPNGRTAKYNWVIPKFVAEEDPTLLSFYGLSGLSGEDKRRKLAERFKRPLSWLQYCDAISKDNCQTPDETAVRAPQDEDEGSQYFQTDVYRGYFMATSENDCDAYPHNCTGHIVDYGCQQSTYVKQQSHWLDIPLRSSGPLKPNGGYPSKFVPQIWSAANATNYSIIMYYANTNPFQLQFQNTPYEFQKVILPEPTVECLANRVTEEDRCSDDPIQQVGQQEGSCDTNPLALKKYIVGSLRDNTFAQPEATRSPAYDIIKAMEISTLDMLSIMKAWNHDSDSDYSKYYGSREAVCHWVADNIDDLTSKMIPRTYPRDLQIQSIYDDDTSRALLFVALALGALALLAVALSAGLTWLWSKRKVMIYAQPVFLNLILSGMLMVSISAILHATPPSLGSCVARQWLSTLGFSMILVPLSVKVNAINQLFNSSKKMKRIQIDKTKLYKTVLAVITFVIVYLIIWTVVDPPTKQSEAVLTADDEDDMMGIGGGSGSFVQVVHYCASTDSQYWKIGSLLYLIVLLLVATVMATQSKNVISDFNETKYLAAMIYCHFLFVLLRFLIFLFGDKVAADNWYYITPGVTSLFLSLDAMVSLSIYFVPKFRAATSQPTTFSANKRSVAGSIAASLQSETIRRKAQHDAMASSFSHSNMASTTSYSEGGTLRDSSVRTRSYYDVSAALVEEEEEEEEEDVTAPADSGFFEVSNSNISSHDDVVLDDDNEQSGECSFDDEEERQQQPGEQQQTHITAAHEE